MLLEAEFPDLTALEDLEDEFPDLTAPDDLEEELPERTAALDLEPELPDFTALVRLCELDDLLCTPFGADDLLDPLRLTAD